MFFCMGRYYVIELLPSLQFIFFKKKKGQAINYIWQLKESALNVLATQYFFLFDLGVCKRTPLMPLQLKCCHFHNKLLFLGVLVYNSTVKKNLHSNSCISSFNLRENFTKNLESWQFHHFKFGRNQMKKMSVVLNALFFCSFSLVIWENTF